MANNKFDEFVNNQLAIAKREKKIDWEKKRNEWVNNLDNFYTTIKRFLKDYISKEKINLTCEKKTISEEYIGDYEVDSYTISIGKNKIKLDPIGTNIIGAKGRVDMIGPYGKVRFVLDIEKRTGGTWKIATPPPKHRIL